MKKPYEFDVVISYAGPDRAVAEQLAQLLLDRGVSVFCDFLDPAALWGKRLYPELGQIYEERGRYCIVLLSKHYQERIWTKHELGAAFNRAVREKEYLLPIRIDNTEIDGLPKDLAYLSLASHSLDEIADDFARKLSDSRIISNPHLPSSIIEAVYTNRLPAIDMFITKMSQETNEIMIVTHTAHRFLTISANPPLDRLRKVLIERSEAHGVRIRILMSDPSIVETRAVQEGRERGALRREQEHSLDLLSTHFPFIEIAFLATPPIYFAILTTKALLFNPYLYIREAFNSPSMVFIPSGGEFGLYEHYAMDMKSIWESSLVTRLQR
jgi:hypothetical protein